MWNAPNAPTPWEFKNPLSFKLSGHLGFLQSRLRSLKFRTHFSPWAKLSQERALGHDGASSVIHSSLYWYSIACGRWERTERSGVAVWSSELELEQPGDGHFPMCAMLEAVPWIWRHALDFNCHQHQIPLESSEFFSPVLRYTDICDSDLWTRK